MSQRTGSRFKTAKDIQIELQRIVDVLTNKSKVGFDIDLMKIGIDELSVIKILIDKIEKIFLVKIGIYTIYKYPTINELATYIYSKLRKEQTNIKTKSSTLIQNKFGKIEFFNLPYYEDDDYSNCVITKNNITISDSLINIPHEYVLFSSDFIKGISDIDEELYSVVEKNETGYIFVRRNNKLKVLNTFKNINNRHEGLPMWMIHPLQGGIDSFKHINYKDGPLYGIYPSNNRRNMNIDVAEYYDLIKIRQPNGPYIIGGYSYGARIAWSIARKLAETANDKIKLILIDNGPEVLSMTTEDFDTELYENFKQEYLNSGYDYLSEKVLESLPIPINTDNFMNLVSRLNLLKFNKYEKIDSKIIEVVCFKPINKNKFDRLKLSDECKYTEILAEFSSTRHMSIMMDPCINKYNFSINSSVSMVHVKKGR